MYDEFGNLIIGGPNKGGYFNAPNLSQFFPQNDSLAGFNPNYGKSYSQPNPIQQSAPTLPPIPSQFSLSGTSMKPGYENFMKGATLANQDEMPSGGGLLKTVTNVASKANPYLALGTAALGGLQTIVGAIGLARSKQPEGYKETPEMARAIGEAERSAQYGLGAQQLALANQQAREAQNTQLFNARSMAGGNLSRAIFGANTYNRLMAGNQLAAQDFAAQQQKVGIRNQLYGTRQRLADANTQLAQQNFARQQEAYGGAMRSGLTNLGSFFNLNQALNYNPAA
jgi:hypothetical protein